MNRFVIIIIFFFISCNKQKVELDKDYKSLDSLSKIIDGSRYYSEEVENSIENYKMLLEQKEKDSTYRIYLNLLSNHYFNYGKWDEYIAACRKNLKLSEKSKDSILIAKYYNDIGDYHYQLASNDSAYLYYTKAIKWLKMTRQEDKIGQVILSKARLLLYENNFAESEIQTVRALKYGKNFQNNRLVFDSYTVLGLTFHELNDFKMAIYYFNLALNELNIHKEEFNSEELFAQTYNNIGRVYLKSNNHKKAQENFRKGLNVANLKKINPLVYAILLDNLAYSKLQNKEAVSEVDFLIPLKVRDSVSNNLGVVVSYTRLGEWSLSKKDTLKAIDYFTKGLKLSEEVKSYRDKLKLLEFLSLTEPEKTLEYKNEIIALNDKLLTEERAIRNKFIRIEYETDEILSEKEKISKQRTLIAVFSSILILILLLVYIIFRQKSNHKILLLNQLHQKSNEEIFNLMIDQQNKIEEGRNSERSRISKELHDGVQSKLMGIRLNLSVLKVKQDEKTLENSLKYIGKLRELEKEIRDISHDLNRDIFFHKENFVLLIENLIQDNSENVDTEIILKIENDIIWNTISNALKINLYRIIQEGLQNVIKYSKANHAIININATEDQLQLRIIDDGIGMNVLKVKKGIGLSNINDRTKSLKGTFEIKSQPDKGTELIISIPLNE